MLTLTTGRSTQQQIPGSDHGFGAMQEQASKLVDPFKTVLRSRAALCCGLRARQSIMGQALSVVSDPTEPGSHFLL